MRRVQSQAPLYAAARQRDNQATLSATGPPWAAPGDPMTLGIEASAYDRGWVGQLGRRLTRDSHRYRIVNLSFSGARAADVLDLQLPAMQEPGQQSDLATVLTARRSLPRERSKPG